jgi:hypothetical protein
MVSALEVEARLTSRERKSKGTFIQTLLPMNGPRYDKRVTALRGSSMSRQD